MKNILFFIFTFLLCFFLLYDYGFSQEAIAVSPDASSVWMLLWTWLIANKEIFIVGLVVDVLGYFIAKSKNTTAVSLLSFIKDLLLKVFKKK